MCLKIRIFWKKAVKIAAAFRTPIPPRWYYRQLLQHFL